MLARIHQEYGAKDVDILALNVIPATSDRAFVDYMKARGGEAYYYATDTQLTVAQAYRIQYLGTLVAIDGHGQIAAQYIEPVSYDQLKETIEQLQS